jgi:hypothetical protein
MSCRTRCGRLIRATPISLPPGPTAHARTRVADRDADAQSSLFSHGAREYHASSSDVNPDNAEPVSPTKRSAKDPTCAAKVESRADERQQALCLAS